MAIYREDLADVELESGKILRTWMHRSIGLADIKANRFGVRVLRGGQPVNIEGSSCIGFFQAPDGTNLQISGSTYTGVSGNTAWVQLPQNAYAYEGKFTLAIKLVGGGVTGTMRMIDGTVDNTGTTGSVSPTSEVPSSAEIIAAYEQAVAVVDGAVRHDIVQSIDDTGKGKARANIDAAGVEMAAPKFAAATANPEESYVTKDGGLYWLPDGHAANDAWSVTANKQVTVGSELAALKDMAGDVDRVVSRETAIDTSSPTTGGIKGTVGSELETTTTDSYKYVIFAATPETEYRIKTCVGAGTTYPYHVFELDADDIVIKREYPAAASAAVVSGSIVTTPQTAKLAVMDYGTAVNHMDITKVEKAEYNSLQLQVSENLAEMDERTGRVALDPDKTDVSVTMSEGGIRGEIGYTLSTTSTSSYHYTIVDADPKVIYEITTYVYTSALYPWYVFELTADNVVIAHHFPTAEAGGLVTDHFRTDRRTAKIAVLDYGSSQTHVVVKKCVHGYVSLQDQIRTAGKLYGKKWAVLGDSFTNGATNTKMADGLYKGKNYVYPYIIGNRTGIEVLKFFGGGRTLAFPGSSSSTSRL